MRSFLNCSICRSSHSHTTKTSQPMARSVACCRLSRIRFVSSFGCQKSNFDLGRRASLHAESGWRCQKQPCTNTTFRRAGKTKSGHPGRSRRCRRYRYPSACNSRRTTNSGPVSLFRTRAMRALRSDRLKVSMHHTSRLCSTAAAMKPRNRGCGSKGRLFSSGWNWTPTNQG